MVKIDRVFDFKPKLVFGRVVDVVKSNDLYTDHSLYTKHTPYYGAVESSQTPKFLIDDLTPKMYSVKEQ